jgi:pyridoxamine 5'-phosphate oxidase
MSAIELFNTWYNEEIRISKVAIPSACCFSTNGTDGYPNARYVSLKEIINGCFIVTGTTSSRKGIEINESHKVALTFWWTNTARQVRVQGDATLIDDQMADYYFSKRNRDSQIVSILSTQGNELISSEILHEQYTALDDGYKYKEIPRPKNFSGYRIQPIRIEFLEFQPSRFHTRTLYELQNGQWTTTDLQP